MNKRSHYLVGGAVRDELLGLPVADRDFVVIGASVEEMISNGFMPVGRDFPVFLHPHTKEEYALARTERKTGRGHQGFSFHADPSVTLAEDLARRDLTINAIAKSSEDEFIDPFQGIDDIKNKVLRHVSAAFVEDPLRVLRVCRFTSTLNFDIHPDTLKLMIQLVNTDEINDLSPERIWSEILKGLMGKKPSRMIDSLIECGALNAINSSLSHGVYDLENKKIICETLDLAATKNLPIEARVAIFCLLTEHDVEKIIREYIPKISKRKTVAESVLNQLKATKSQTKTSMLLLGHIDSILNAAKLTNEQIVDLVMHLDGLRQPERFEKILDAAATTGQAVAGQSCTNHVRILIVSLKILKSIKHNDFSKIDSTSEINERVRSARIIALDKELTR